MATAYSYIRCSTPEQLKGDTLRRQLADSQEWAQRHGHVLDDQLRDLGRSAFKGGHAKFGALRAFLDLVEDGQVERGSFLVVESLDRLSREAVLDALPRLLDLIASGITVVTLADGQEYSDQRLRSDPSPLIMSLLIMMRAHEESRTKSMRVGKAWAQKRVRAAEDGQAMTAICPGWIRLVGGPRAGRYELIEDRAAVVQRIFEQTINGIGRRTIAKALNAQRVPTWGLGRKRGAHWHDSYIQKILENPAAYGRYEPLSKRAGGDGSAAVPPIDEYFPAAISRDTFYAAQASAKSRSGGGGRTSAGHRNLLRGLAKCASCGGNLTIIDKGKRSSGPKLICSSANMSAGCTDRTFHPYADLERGVLWTVGSGIEQLVASSRDKLAAVRQRRDGEIARRAEVAQRVENLVELVAAGGGGAVVAGQVASLQEELTTIDRTIAALDTEIGAVTPAEAADLGSSFGELLRRLRADADEPGVRAQVAQRLKGMIDRIDVSPGDATVHLASGEMGHVQFVG